MKNLNDLIEKNILFTEEEFKNYMATRVFDILTRGGYCGNPSPALANKYYQTDIEVSEMTYEEYCDMYDENIYDGNCASEIADAIIVDYSIIQAAKADEDVFKMQEFFTWYL